jgi:restriction endonuclease S subunit
MRDGWVETALGELAEITTGSRAKGGAISSGIPSIGGEQIAEDRSIKFNKMKFIPEEHFESMRTGKLKFGDSLLVKDGATTGKVGYWGYSIPAAVNEHVFILRARPDKAEPYFINLLISHQSFREEIESRTRGIIGGITRDIENIEFVVPLLPEQKRIVDLISSVDSYIGALQQQLESAKRSRNAVLLELLTAGGEEWVETTLGEIANWGSGGTPKADNPDFYDGEIPWCVIGDLTESEVWETEKRITNLGISNSSAKVIDPGSVLLAMYGASIGRTGISAIPMATNQAIAFARCHPNLALPKYLLAYLQTQKSKFVEMGQGAAQPNISQTIIKSWPIDLPPIPYQNHLVSTMDVFDATLFTLQSNIHSSKLLRSSLLSDLLSGEHEIPASYDKVMGAA